MTVPKLRRLLIVAAGLIAALALVIGGALMARADGSGCDALSAAYYCPHEGR